MRNSIYIFLRLYKYFVRIFIRFPRCDFVDVSSVTYRFPNWALSMSTNEDRSLSPWTDRPTSGSNTCRVILDLLICITTFSQQAGRDSLSQDVIISTANGYSLSIVIYKNNSVHICICALSFNSINIESLLYY